MLGLLTSRWRMDTLGKAQGDPEPLGPQLETLVAFCAVVLMLRSGPEPCKSCGSGLRHHILLQRRN